MKPNFYTSFSSYRVAVVLAIVGSPAGFAQGNANGNSDHAKQVMTASADAFARNDDDAAIAKLTDENVTKPNTPEWHLESANRLTQVAFNFRDQQRYDAARKVAQFALRDLDKAAARFSESSDLAACYELAGLIQERLLNDPKAAQQNYAQALTLVPDRKHAAHELQRLQTADRLEQAKVDASKR